MYIIELWVNGQKEVCSYLLNFSSSETSTWAKSSRILSKFEFNRIVSMQGTFKRGADTIKCHYKSNKTIPNI